MEFYTKTCLARCLVMALTIAATRARTFHSVGTPLINHRVEGHVASLPRSGDGCMMGTKAYAEGEIIFQSQCILILCFGGKSVDVRDDCVDSKGQCHRHGETWTQGCTEYRCQVSKVTNPDGSVTTKYEPVTIRKCAIP